MAALGYDLWENISKVIQKAVQAYKGVEAEVKNHFRGVAKMVQIGSGTKRNIENIILTVYACYLIAQNRDPSKTEIAVTQTYFALQIHKQELIEEDIKKLGPCVKSTGKKMMKSAELPKKIDGKKEDTV